MMTQVQFYHLTATPIERALPKLLEKALVNGQRVLVVESAPEKLDYFNQMLWTYSTNTFLPHGAAADGNPEAQPIFLSPTPEAKNGAKTALITDSSLVADTAAFERIIDLFNGNDPDALAHAKERQKHYMNSGMAVSYLRQNESGGWEEKAAA